MRTNYKIIICILSIITFTSSYASISECMDYVKSKDWDNIIKYCPEYANDNSDITKVLSGAYAYKYNGIKAQIYLQKYVDKFANQDKDTGAVALAFMSLGNYYYFGEDGAKKDIKKGLEYITKGAQLGNSIAQEQLGNFYNSNDGELPKLNTSISYKWFEIASINGSQKAKSNVFLRNISVLKEQVPYCIAMGQQLVTQSYIEGTGGLSKNDNQARQYLIQAIELYKEAKKPSEDELKYCPPQKGLDLASAEKLLKSL